MVAAALIPPNHVQQSSLDQTVSTRLQHGDDPWDMTRNQMFNISNDRYHEPSRRLKEELKNKIDKIKSGDKWNDSINYQPRESTFLFEPCARNN